MSKPDVTIGTATKRADFLKLVEYVSKGDYIDGSAGTTTLTTADFGRTVIINSASARQVSLPSVDTPEIGGWFRVVKLGAGAVTIQAADSDIINGGAAGGSIICNVAGETFAYITLRLVSGTAWVIESGMGSWNTSANMFLLGYPDGPLLKQIATPSTPAAGYDRLYGKSDKLLYHLNSDGIETQLADGASVIPILGTRRWAAGRATGAAWLNLLLDTVYGGTGSYSFPSAEPHYLRLASGALAGDAYYWTSQNSSWLTTKGGLFDVTFRVNFESLVGAKAWVGLTDSIWSDYLPDPASKHLAIFRYSVVHSPNIYACTKDGATLNAVDTGVAAAASWFTLRIRAVSASSIEFFVNGVKTNTLTANLPTASLILFVMVATAGSASKYLQLGSFFGSFNG